MGRKADELREELELVEAERRALVRQNAELLAEIDSLKNSSAGIVTSAPRRAPTAPENEDDEPTADRALAVSEMAAADLQAIQELHRPARQPDRVESALDVVRANNNERSSLQETVRLNNSIINRVAAQLRVDQWDKDGTEIIVKVQQWTNFAHWIKQRQRVATGEVANELGTVLAALVAPADLAAWIMSKPGETVPGVVVDVAEARAQASTGPVTRETLARFDVWWIVEALKTDRGTRELLALINLVLLPFLSRPWPS